MPRPRSTAALLALACACARAPSNTTEALAELPAGPPIEPAAVVEPEPEPAPEPEPPPITRDLLETLGEVGGHAELLAAIERAGLSERLREDAPTTLLAPTDAAFTGLSRRDRQRLDRAPELAKTLRRHVLVGVHTLAGLAAAAEVETVDGEALPVVAGPEGVTVGGLRIVAEHAARGGAVLVVESLLPPPRSGKARAPKAAAAAPAG